MSIAGLAKLLPLASRATVNEASSKQLRCANLDLFERLRKVLKVQLHSGGALDWEVLDFSKTLPFFLAASTTLRRLYTEAITKFPPSDARPWSAVVAFDEFCPGNKLQVLGDSSKR